MGVHDTDMGNSKLTVKPKADIYSKCRLHVVLKAGCTDVETLVYFGVNYSSNDIWRDFKTPLGLPTEMCIKGYERSLRNNMK